MRLKRQFSTGSGQVYKSRVSRLLWYKASYTYFMNLLKNSYALGVLMVIAELLINNILLAARLPHISGIILAIFAGSIYSAYHKEKMPFKERVKTLATYLVLAGVAGIFAVFTGVGASAPGLAIAIMLGMLVLYAIFMYFMLGVGSSGYMTAYEKQQAAIAAQQPVSEQNPLTPIPNAKEFQNKHPKIAIILALIGCTALFVGGVFIVMDPLFEANIRFVMGGLSALIALTIVGALWRVFGKKIWTAVVGTVVLALIVLGVHMHIANLPAPAAGVDKMMIAYQEVALRCVEKGADLRGKLSGWNRGMPQVESAICSQESSWKMLPAGWKYIKILDADVSDGTFTFGAHSRAGDFIICGEKWCVHRDAKGEDTILSTVPSPLSATITLPESKSVHQGEEVEVAQMTLINSTDKPVDLRAFWYKKSGTASNSAIEMVHIVEGDNTRGMNFMHYLGRSTSDMVYFDEPGMFKLEPGQSRTYSVQIELNSNMPLEIGKTIGLDFVGFSHDPQVEGMPASGAIHTIQQ